MRGKHGKQPSADRQHRWSGDRKIIASTGYVRVRVGRSHPLADPNGYAYEHLLVWVSAGNSRPASSFVLHHRNEVKTDNRIENLELIRRGEHNRRHNDERGRDAATGQFLGKSRAGRLLDGREHNGMPG